MPTRDEVVSQYHSLIRTARDKPNTQTGTGAPCLLPTFAQPRRVKMRLRHAAPASNSKATGKRWQ